MLSLILMEKIASLFIMIFAGFLLVKLKVLKAADSKLLSTIALYVVLPCVIISSFQIEATPETRDGVMFSFAAGLALNALLIICSRLLRRPLKLSPAEELSAGYPNAVNLVLPLVISIFGSEFAIYVNGYSTVQTVLLFSHALIVINGSNISLRKILTNVNVIACVIGIVIFLTGFKLPSVIGGAMSAMGAMIGPINMLVIGMLFGGMSLRSFFLSPKAYLVTALRLLIFPAAILLLIKLTGVVSLIENGKTIMLIGFLAVCAPCANTITQMAQVYGGDSERASCINAMSVLLCIVTMPLMVMLYQKII